MARLTKAQQRQQLEDRIKKGVGAWKISKYIQRGQERVGFHNKKGWFITSVPLNEETIDLLRVNAKKVVVRGRLKDIRVPQTLQISYYSQSQATELSKKVRKGIVPLQEDRNRRDIDLLLDKIIEEYMNNIKFTS